MVFFVISRALGFVREMVIAGQFGTSAELDAYLAAFRLPDLLFQLVAGGALASAFIPTFTTCLVDGDEEGSWRLASAIANWLLLILGLLGVLAGLVAPLIVAYVVAPGFGPEQQRLTVELMRWMLISTVVFALSGLVMGILNARGHFLTPALAPVVYNVSIICGALFLSPFWGVRGLVAGVVVGAIGHLLVQVPVLVAQGARYTPNLSPRDPAVREVARLMGPRVLGLAAVQMSFIVNVALASTLPEGRIVALNYGWIIMLLPQGIIAQAVATAAFPTLSELAARNDEPGLTGTLNKTMLGVIALTLPAAAALFFLRVPVVRILLERGEFGPESTRATAWALGFYSLGLLGHSTVEIMTRAFYALHDTRTPVTVGVATMLLNVALNIVLMRLFASAGLMAHGGLALASSIAVTLEMFALFYLLKKRLPGLLKSF